jgi:hypothetical protein
MSPALLSFDEVAGQIVVCGARVIVRRGGVTFDPSDWALVEMERGYSRRRRSCELGVASLWTSDGVPTMLSVSSAMVGDELGWSGWTEDREDARKRANDAATIAAFGAVENTFEWGAVQSRYDARTGGAAITVAFRREPLWKRFGARLCSTVCRRRS